MGSSIIPPSGRKGFYIDVMENGRFLCQLHYTRRGFPVVIDGKNDGDSRLPRHREVRLREAPVIPQQEHSYSIL